MSKRRRYKTCTECGKRKALKKFHRYAYSSDGRKSACAECGRQRSRTYYKKNRQAKIKATQERRKRTSTWLSRLKRKRGCSRCPEGDPVCLDFHHRDPTTKLMAVATMLRLGYAKKAIAAEIKKCDVVCANCHRKLHHGSSES